MHLSRVLKNEELNVQLWLKDGILAKMAQTPELGRGNVAPATTAAGTVYPEDQTRQNRGFRQMLA